jgi:hypothetical protein
VLLACESGQINQVLPNTIRLTQPSNLFFVSANLQFNNCQAKLSYQSPNNIKNDKNEDKLGLSCAKLSSSCVEPFIGVILSSWLYHKLCFLISSCSGTILHDEAATYKGTAAAYWCSSHLYDGLN